MQLGNAGCAPGASPFVERWFHDCVYTLRDGISFTLGITSIGLWIMAQLPQFIDNIRNQSAEALSVWFLAQWFLGDTLNLLGCLLSGDQLATTTALAMWFVLSDVFMLTQYVYYGALQRRRQLLHAKSVRRSMIRRQSQIAGRSGVQSTVLPGAGQRQPHRKQQHSAAPVDGYGEAEDSHDGLPAAFVPITEAAGPGWTTSGGGAPGTSQPEVLVLVPGTADMSGQPHDSGQAHPPRQAAGAGEGGPAMLRRRSVPGTGVVVTAASLLSIVTLGIGSRAMHDPGPWVGVPAGGMEGSAWGLDSSHAVHGLGLLGRHDHKGGPVPWYQDIDFLVHVLGSVFGYCSAVLYLSSRLSQIYKNWERKSAEGLSVAMFVFTISANLCTGCSILLRLKDVQAFLAQAPWIGGAFGTVGLDAFIFYQARYYHAHPPPGHAHHRHSRHTHHHHHHHHHAHRVDSAHSVLLPHDLVQLEGAQGSPGRGLDVRTVATTDPPVGDSTGNPLLQPLLSA